MAKTRINKRMFQIGLIGLLLVCAFSHLSFAAVPHKMNFQAVMTDDEGNPVPDGDYHVNVKLYESEGATDCIWSEVHNPVTIVDGYMEFHIGGGALEPDPEDPTKLDYLTPKYFDDKNRWLEIDVVGLPAMDRIKLTSVPFAFRVGSIDGAVGGKIQDDLTVTGEIIVDKVGTIGLDDFILQANDQRALKIEPSAGTTSDYYDNSSPNILAGYSHNLADELVNGATISGGGCPDRKNMVTGNFGTIGGGADNTAGDHATVCGGYGNLAENYGTVAGGDGNTASGAKSFAVGVGCQATGRCAFAAGDGCNAGGSHSFSLGANCEASAPYSFALGRNAKASNQGSFIWSCDDMPHETTADDQFKVRAWGGIEFHSGVGVRVNCTQYQLSGIPADCALAVNGTIGAKEIVVTENNWPDYVFQDDYTLRSFEQLEQEIEANKHLPGIPCADEIEANGLPMGEMQRLMMEKIEELTLYVLQLNKEKQELRERIESLEQH